MTKKQKYFTDVFAQTGGNYTVKHETLKGQKEYEKKLAQQYPSFIKVKSGKLNPAQITKQVKRSVRG